jgi:import receptor subunit TOM70
MLFLNMVCLTVASPKAISECPIENPNEASTFYQNRAAAFDKLKVTAKVIEDCTSALRNDEKYIKAQWAEMRHIHRRM